jgi:hypothetical protein
MAGYAAWLTTLDTLDGWRCLICRVDSYKLDMLAKMSVL